MKASIQNCPPTLQDVPKTTSNTGRKHQKSYGSSGTSSKKAPVTKAPVTNAPVPKAPVVNMPVTPAKSKVVKTSAPSKTLLPAPLRQPSPQPPRLGNILSRTSRANAKLLPYLSRLTKILKLLVFQATSRKPTLVLASPSQLLGGGCGGDG